MIDVEGAYNRYGAMVYRRCRTLLGNDDEAMDAVQDVFVDLVRRADSWDERALAGLLMKMSTFVCLKKLRTRRRRAETSDLEMVERIALCFDDSEDRVFLGQLFRRQSEKTKLIAVLHHVDGLTHAETAEQVGMSVSGVRRRLRAMQEALRKLAEADDD